MGARCPRLDCLHARMALDWQLWDHCLTIDYWFWGCDTPCCSQWVLDWTSRNFQSKHPSCSPRNLCGIGTQPLAIFEIRFVDVKKTKVRMLRSNLVYLGVLFTKLSQNKMGCSALHNSVYFIKNLPPIRSYLNLKLLSDFWTTLYNDSNTCRDSTRTL